jgi:hypothetical protein
VRGAIKLFSRIKRARRRLRKKPLDNALTGIAREGDGGPALSYPSIIFFLRRFPSRAYFSQRKRWSKQSVGKIDKNLLVLLDPEPYVPVSGHTAPPRSFTPEGFIGYRYFKRAGKD